MVSRTEIIQIALNEHDQIRGTVVDLCRFGRR